MAEQSKFPKASGRLSRPASVTPKVQYPDGKPSAAPTRQVIEAAKSGSRGGKRSDPAYTATTFFVRRETKRNASRLLLEDAYADKDLSDLVEELLGEWVYKHTNV
jgi:hypothetical protein